MAKKKTTDSARKQEKLPFPSGITLNDGTVPPGKHSPGKPVSGDPGETAEAGYYKLKLKAGIDGILHEITAAALVVHDKAVFSPVVKRDRIDTVKNAGEGNPPAV